MSYSSYDADSFSFNPIAKRVGPASENIATGIVNGGDATAYAAPPAPRLQSKNANANDQRGRLAALLERLGIDPAAYGVNAYAEGGSVGTGDITTSAAPDVTTAAAIPAPGSTNDLNLQLQQLIGKLSAPQAPGAPPVTPAYESGGGGAPSGDSSDSSAASGVSNGSEGSPGSSGSDSGSGGNAGPGGDSGAGDASSGGGEGGAGAYANGGLIALAGGGKLARGPGGGLDDLIPTTIDGRRAAALSDGEFVIPADVVSMMGDGSSNAGSKRLYDMVRAIRQNKTGTSQQAGPLPVGDILKRVM